MSGVDISKLQAGDRIRIRHLGLEGWQEVGTIGRRGFVTEPAGIYFALDGNGSLEGGANPEILEHEPAPKKVELALGDPLPDANSERQYLDAVEASHGGDEGEIWLRISKGESLLTYTEAERLALDILATVYA